MQIRKRERKKTKSGGNIKNDFHLHVDPISEKLKTAERP